MTQTTSRLKTLFRTGITLCAFALLVVPWLISGCTTIPLPTATATLAPSATASATPSQTATASATPSPTATATATTTATPTFTPSPTPVPLTMAVSLAGSEVMQGHITMIEIETNRPCVVSGALGMVEVRFHATQENHYAALVGIHALTEPGLQEALVTAKSEDGQVLTLATQIRIIEAGYAHETLSFAPAIARLLDPEIVRPELERLALVYGGETPEKRWQGRFSWPWQGPVTSAFGTRRDYGGVIDGYHAGIDLDGVTGDPIAAPADGVVVMAEELDVRGKVVIIDHGWGVHSGLYHLSAIDVSVGDQVARGDIVGEMGATGLVTGSHLHWELQVHGVPVSPREWTQRAYP